MILVILLPRGTPIGLSAKARTPSTLRSPITTSLAAIPGRRREILFLGSNAFARDGQSVLKDRWVAIRKGSRVCYAQWEDVGPFQVDHWQYVFGNERPRPNVNR